MNGATLLWREIANKLERQIRSRDLSPSDKLPTEEALSRQFMVNRHAVRRALLELQEKGMIESMQGRGTVVRRPARPMRLTRRPRFTEGVRTRVGEPEIVSPPITEAPDNSGDQKWN